VSHGRFVGGRIVKAPKIHDEISLLILQYLISALALALAVHQEATPPPRKATVNKLYFLRLPLPAWALEYYFYRCEKMSSLTADAAT
jgi:hypothetical protein